MIDQRKCCSYCFEKGRYSKKNVKKIERKNGTERQKIREQEDFEAINDETRTRDKF